MQVALPFTLTTMSTRHARTADKALNERLSKTLKDLLKLPANKYCADCKRKGIRIEITRPFSSCSFGVSGQIHDGRPGIWASLYAFAALVSTALWEHILVKVTVKAYSYGLHHSNCFIPCSQISRSRHLGTRASREHGTLGQ